MNNEIKEILDRLKKCDYDDFNKVLDYITNLQEEINKLTAESTEWESKYYDLEKLNNANYLSFIDCNSRINKATEMLKRYGNGTFDEELLKILEGSDKE